MIVVSNISINKKTDQCAHLDKTQAHNSKVLSPRLLKMIELDHTQKHICCIDDIHYGEPLSDVPAGSAVLLTIDTESERYREDIDDVYGDLTSCVSHLLLKRRLPVRCLLLW